MNQYLRNIRETPGKHGLRTLMDLLRFITRVFLLVYTLFSGQVFAMTQCGNNSGVAWPKPDGIDDGVGGSNVETLIASSEFNLGLRAANISII